MQAKKEIPHFTPDSRSAWRCWLEQNHQKETAVWLVYYKSNTGKPTVTYSDAVDEALCFGWIDSKALSIDEERYKQYYTVRKPTSVWSKVNKEKVAKLTAEGLMQPAGLAIIETAKQNGMWTKLDDAEALKIPSGLKKAFKQFPGSETFFKALSRTDKRNLLQWIVLAKQDATKEKRMTEIARLAAERKKPKGF